VVKLGTLENKLLGCEVVSKHKKMQYLNIISQPLTTWNLRS